MRQLHQELDAQRAKDFDRVNGTPRKRNAAKANDEGKLTVDAVGNASRAHAELNQAIKRCQALLRGEVFTITVNGMIGDVMVGKEYRAIRACLLRSSLQDLNYRYSLANQHLQLDHMTQLIHAIRLGIDESLNGGGE